MELDRDQEEIIRKYEMHKMHVMCSRCNEKGRFQRDSHKGERLRFTCKGAYTAADGNSGACNEHVTEAVMEGLLDGVITSNSTDKNKDKINSNIGASAQPVSSSTAASAQSSSSSAAASTTNNNVPIAATLKTSTYGACGSLLPPNPLASGAGIKTFIEQRIFSDEQVVQTFRDIDKSLSEKPDRHYQNLLLFYLRLDLFVLWLRAHSMNAGVNLYFLHATSADGSKRTDDFSKIAEVFPPGTEFTMSHKCEHWNMWPELTKEDLKAKAGKPRKINGPEYPANKTFRPSQQGGYGCQGGISSDVEWVRLIKDGPLVGVCMVKYTACFGHKLGQRRRMYVVRTKAAVEAPPSRSSYSKYDFAFGEFGEFGGSDYGNDDGSDYDVNEERLSRKEAQLLTLAKIKSNGGLRAIDFLSIMATTRPSLTQGSSLSSLPTSRSTPMTELSTAPRQPAASTSSSASASTSSSASASTS
ncbi:hypothetical protein BGX24_004950, partial [Mortierella sp. AD032]